MNETEMIYIALLLEPTVSLTNINFIQRSDQGQQGTVSNHQETIDYHQDRIVNIVNYSQCVLGVSCHVKTNVYSTMQFYLRTNY